MNETMKMISLPASVILTSIAFKIVAMIFGILGNTTVVIYTIFSKQDNSATSYLVGNLAVADLLVCSTFYPIWIMEFMKTVLNIDSDQSLFCKLTRSTLWALLIVSVGTLLAITADRYFYIVKPLKYPLIVTQRRIILTISGTWCIAISLCIVFYVYYTKSNIGLRSFCDVPLSIALFSDIFVGSILTLIFLLNLQILRVARSQRKKIHTITGSRHFCKNYAAEKSAFYRAMKSSKTFFIVVLVLALFCFVPTIIGTLIEFSICDTTCQQVWFLVFQYELYGINSIVNSFIYGLRHVKYRKACRDMLLRIFRCHKPS